MELTKLAIETALKAISFAQPDVRKSYKLQRTLERVGQLSLTRRSRRAVDMVVEGDGPPVPVRVFYPEGEDASWDSAIVFFHGGGWVTGDIDTYDRVCAVTARNTGCPVASVDYRLAPENRFPCAPEDCYRRRGTCSATRTTCWACRRSPSSSWGTARAGTWRRWSP